MRNAQGTMHAAGGIRRAACGSFALNAAAGKIQNEKYKTRNAKYKI